MKLNLNFKTSLLIIGILSFLSCGTLKKGTAYEEFTNSSVIRFASFNTSLNRSTEGGLINDLSSPENVQAKLVAEIIQRQNPDVIALLEFDFDVKKEAIKLFQKNYLNVSQNNVPSVNYKHVYVASSNTGKLMEVDVNGDGLLSIPQDTYGFGFFPGQYSFVVLSKYEIIEEDIRTFQKFKWNDMPNAMLPLKQDGNLYYSKEVMDVFRLSSKNHVDIPIKIANHVIIHAIVAHPTPPVFDGIEDRNGTRNHDEIRLLNDYVSGESYLYDDDNNFGGITKEDKFVIMGDLNADSFDGESTMDPINYFEKNELINQNALTGNKIPSSKAGLEFSIKQGCENLKHNGNPSYDTADFGDKSPNSGNLRVDYVLPSANLKIVETGVFWPMDSDSTVLLNKASDHKLVWVDVLF